MTYAEIAELLGWPMGTVQIRIHRARLRLRERAQAALRTGRGTMKKRPHDPIASLLADGEAPPEQRSRLERSVGARRGRRDPALVGGAAGPGGGSASPIPSSWCGSASAATRSRRPRSRPSRGVAPPSYLLPLAASALLGAVFAVWTSTQRGNALGELEMRELGKGVADVTLETTSVEPVLRIALGEL